MKNKSKEEILNESIDKFAHSLSAKLRKVSNHDIEFDAMQTYVDQENQSLKEEIKQLRKSIEELAKEIRNQYLNLLTKAIIEGDNNGRSKDVDDMLNRPY